MNPSQSKLFKWYSFYDDSIYNQIFENLTPSLNETLLYSLVLQRPEGTLTRPSQPNCMASITKLYESSVICAESIKDLGVLIVSKLHFHHQVDYDIIYLAINLLGLIRTVTFFCSSVQSFVY